jgi:hypothetical protein
MAWFPAIVWWLIIRVVGFAVWKLVLRFDSVYDFCEVGLCTWLELPAKVELHTPSPVVEFTFLYLMCSMKPLP